MDSVTIVDVAPRDGFQSVGKFVPTDDKLAIIRKLVAAKMPRIEIGSLVNPKILPQMRDTSLIHAALQDENRSEFSVLVPNRKGAEIAIAEGMHNLVYVLSVSEAHNRNNVRRPVSYSIEELHSILNDLRPAGRFRLDIATAFHCPFEGVTPLSALIAILDQVAPLHPEMEICLCDTTGRATPRQVAEAFVACRSQFGFARPWAYHAHDTYGMGLATVWAAYETGVRIFDASAGGLGGCPFAPGASGNVATEDVAYMFENSGIATGLDFGALLDAAELGAEIDGATAGGHVRTLSARRRRQGGHARDPLLDTSDASET